ncbi:cysteine-rich CWC family protein [Crocinitomix catalasitica]|uniref:cysteine-rich CWC family protein n=1 Tax=Crocinitomix catalasitica TaxID=184607 RepID=UPI0009077854
MIKKCSKCQSPFNCNVNDIKACHCSQVKLTPEILAEIKEKYDNCLCNDCLRMFEVSSDYA